MSQGGHQLLVFLTVQGHGNGGSRKEQGRVAACSSHSSHDTPEVGYYGRVARTHDPAMVAPICWFS